MGSEIYPSVLRFLKENGLHKTAKAFGKETSTEAVDEAPELFEVFQWFLQHKKAETVTASVEQTEEPVEKKKKEKKEKKKKTEEQAPVEETPAESAPVEEEVPKKKKKDKKKKVEETEVVEETPVEEAVP